MPSFIPIDDDPFAAPAQPTFVPVDHDPFATAPPNPVAQMTAAAAALGVPATASNDQKAMAIRQATHPHQMQIQGAAAAAASPTTASVLAGAGNVLSGVPIAGPAILGGVQRGSAGLVTALDGGTYADNLNAIQGAQGEADEANPGLKVAGRIGGAVLGSMPAAGTALGARALGLVGSLPARAVQGALGGAAIGGADAAVRGESPEGGATAGGIIGGVVPFVGAGLGTLAKGAMGLGTPVVRGPLADVGPIARGMLSKDVAEETPQSIAAAQARLGPHGLLGELGSSLGDTTGGIANFADASKQVIRGALSARDAGARSRVTDAVTQAFGPSQDIAAVTRADIARRSAAADPLYAAWRSTPVPMTPELETIAELPSVHRAMPHAERMAGDEGNAFLDPNGAPTAQTWDYLKRSLDDAGRTAGYGTNEARIANAISRRITSAIDNHPDPSVAGVWQQARQAWADPTSIMQAREAGQTAFSRNQRADDLAHDLQGYSAPERAAFIQGARDHVDQMMDATRRGSTTARDVLLAPASQQKLAAIIGPQRAGALIDSMHQEVELAQSSTALMKGSPTAPKTEQVKKVSPPEPGGVMDFWKNWKIDQPSSYIPQMRAGFLNSQYENARAQMAPLLTATGSHRDALIQALMATAQQNASQTGTANNIRDLATFLLNSGGGEEARRRVAPFNVHLISR